MKNEVKVTLGHSLPTELSQFDLEDQDLRLKEAVIAKDRETHIRVKSNELPSHYKDRETPWFQTLSLESGTPNFHVLKRFNIPHVYFDRHDLRIGSNSHFIWIAG